MIGITGYHAPFNDATWCHAEHQVQLCSVWSIYARRPRNANQDPCRLQYILELASLQISACYPPRAEPVFASTIEDMTGRSVINVSKLAGKHTTSELTESYSRNARLQAL